MQRNVESLHAYPSGDCRSLSPRRRLASSRRPAGVGLRLAGLALWLLCGSISCSRRLAPQQAQPVEDREGAKRLYAQAQALMRQGAYDEAIAACDQAVQLAPSRVPPYLLRAEILSQVNRFQEAVRDMRTARRLAPNEVGIMLQFLRLLPPYTSYREMEDLARQAVARAPENAEAHYYLGMALVHNPDTKQWREAERELVKASQLAPWMALPLLELGKLYLRQRRFALAQTALEKAWSNLTQKNSPLSAATPPSEMRVQQRNTAFWLHQVYQRQQNPRAQAMGQILQRLRRRVEEEEQLQMRASAVPPDFDAKLTLAQRALQDGDALTAARYAREVLRQRPHDATAQKVLKDANQPHRLPTIPHPPSTLP